MSGTSAAAGTLGSERFRLAQSARDAALSVPGVAGTNAGSLGLFVTAEDKQSVDGVVCAASAEGGYDISLRLICELVPLQGLGERVRREVRRAALASGTRAHSIDVHIVDIVGEVEG